MRLHDRKIRGEFWQDTDLIKNLDTVGRMFFIGLFQIADDSGCVIDDCMSYKMTLFPMDDFVTMDLLTAYRDKLVLIGKLIPYQANKKKCLFIRNFHKHQTLKNCPPPSVPLPPWVEFEAYESNPRQGKYVVNEEKLNQILKGRLRSYYTCLTVNLQRSYGRLHSERKVLSGVTHSEESCIEAISQLEAKDFTEPLHRTLFELIVDTYKKGTFPSYGILLKEASSAGFLDSVRKNEEIKHVLTDWGYTDNIQYWIDELTSASKARACNSVLRKYQAALADNGKQNIDDTLAGAINDLSQIDLGRTKDEFEDGLVISEQLEQILAQKIVRYTEASVSGRSVLEGLSTGFDKLDELTLGYKPGDLIVLAAQTGHGKTAFALQTAKTITVDLGKPVLYINTEMAKEAVYQRLCGVISGVPYYRIRQGSLSQNEQTKVSKAVETIKKSPFIHSYSPHLTPVRCIVLGKKAKIQKRVEMIIVDYIGRMEKFDPKMKEWQVLEQVAKSMKLLAQELKIPVFVLAQLNEDGSLQGAKRIKNECDLLLKMAPLTREEIDKKYGKYANANYKLFIDKNRDGEPEKNIALHYDKPVQQIRSATAKDNPWLKIGREIDREVG